MRNGFLLVVTVLVTVGCTEPGKPEGTFVSAAGGKKYGGVYRLNEVGEVSSLDPVLINDVTSSHVAQNIYDRLVSIDTNLQLIPELAKQWEVSEDGLTYTYHLRTDVWFHDDPCFPNGRGRRLTAADVKFSLTRVCDSRTQSKNVGYFRDKVVGAKEYFEASLQAAQRANNMKGRDVEGFHVVDDSTFQVRLTSAFAPFEHYLALTGMGIHPPEAVVAYGENFFKHPVGTGPFRFVRWEPDRVLILERNPRYWKTDEFGNRLPFLQHVRFSFVKDDKMQLLEFAAGNLEESYRIPNEYFAELVDHRKQPKGAYSRFTLLHVPALSTQFYGFLCTDTIFKDVRIRKALNMAIDRRRIIRYVLRGQAAGPAEHGIVPQSMPGYEYGAVRGYRFHPEAARTLLAQAGYPNGKGLPEITLQLNAGGGRNVQIAEAIQSMLQENLNVHVRLEQVEFGQHLKKIDQGQASFFRLGWVADYPDPETFLNLFYGKLVPTGTGISPINSTRFVNADFDRVFEQAIGTIDRAKRMELYRKAEQIAIDQAPMILIFHDEDYRFLQPYVRGYLHNAMDRLMLHTVWFDV